MALNRDLREFVELLNSTRVDYLIVGAFAVGFHAIPRFTGDLDLFVGTDPSNASRILDVLRKFGFGELDITVEDFNKDREMIQLGRAPNRIDLLPTITGVSFIEAWPDRVGGSLDGIPVHFISRAHLIQNKTALGRLIDLADLAVLRRSE